VRNEGKIRMTLRPFRFGIVAGHVPDIAALTALVRRAEEFGFDTFLTPDPMGQHDPLTVLSGVAATTRLRFGTFVLAAPFRDKHMLAWQARTLHTLSGGRFELGLGTGRPGAEQITARLGREFGSASQRLAMLAETIAEVKQDEDRPKLLLAGSGPKLLGLAGREADILNLSWAPSTTVPEGDVVIERFRQAAGDRVDDIELNLNLISVGNEPAPWVEKFIGATTAELAERGAVTVLPGTPDENALRLRELRERWGVSYITVNADFMAQFAPIIPMLRP